MSYRAASILLLLLLGAGCTSGGDRAPLPANHPANPNASESPIVPPSQTLAAGDVAATAPEAQPDATQHDMSGMSNSTPDMQRNHRHAATQPATAQANVKYTCPMHPDVVSDEPGKCPKCKMKLVPKSQSQSDDAHGGHR